MAHLRAGLKHIAITALAAAARLRMKLSGTPTLIILTYHRVLPLNDSARQFEQPGMVTSPETLENHIRTMRSVGAEIMHLDDWLNKKASGQPLPRLAVSFTFDDGWQDNFQHAYPILRRTKTPATIFLVTRLVNTNDTFWPERVLQFLTSPNTNHDAVDMSWLANYLPSGTTSSIPLSLAKADEVVNRLKELDDQTIIEHLNTSGVENQPSYTGNPQSRSILSLDEIHKMAAEGLIRFGGHTRHHYRLNRLKQKSALEDEIKGCRDDLNELDSGAVPLFCYPNGDITAEGKELVERHFEGACTTKTGWNRSDQDPFNLHRFNLHDGNSKTAQDLLATIGRGLL